MENTNRTLTSPDGAFNLVAELSSKAAERFDQLLSENHDEKTIKLQTKLMVQAMEETMKK